MEQTNSHIDDMVSSLELIQIGTPIGPKTRAKVVLSPKGVPSPPSYDDFISIDHYRYSHAFLSVEKKPQVDPAFSFPIDSKTHLPKLHVGPLYSRRRLNLAPSSLPLPEKYKVC